MKYIKRSGKYIVLSAVVVMFLGISVLRADAKSKTSRKETSNPRNKITVAIDAGHQRYGNNKLEPIGPGRERKS